MAVVDKIDIGLLSVVTHAISDSTNLADMAEQLTQFMVGVLNIKGATLYVHNFETEEFETIASFGLSSNYLNKGPVLVCQSIQKTKEGHPVVISDVNTSDLLQYPQDARKEGIRAIVDLPIQLTGQMVGVLRLYHYETWSISDSDLDNLRVLTDYLGLAMMYTRMLNILKEIKIGLDQVHPIFLR
jgi:transcriptional regulator with GAF, ATPase, and Fis domain